MQFLKGPLSGPIDSLYFSSMGGMFEISLLLLGLVLLHTVATFLEGKFSLGVQSVLRALAIEGYVPSVRRWILEGSGANVPLVQSRAQRKSLAGPAVELLNLTVGGELFTPSAEGNPRTSLLLVSHQTE